MLEGLQRYGWQPYSEGGNVIALTEGGQSITLEPGGQFELSGAAVETLHETCTELNKHLAQVRQVAGQLGVGFMGLGFPREAMSWVAQGWSALIPGTWYVQLRIDQSLRGTPVEISVWPMLWLALITIGLGGLTLAQLARLRWATEVTG